MKFNLDEIIPMKTDNWLFAEDIFHYQFNEVLFYVEDYKQEEMYFCILKKLFKEIKFENIFPLNGKENVINNCKDNVNIKNKIYIVDKDFDDILEKMEIIPNLFYLDKYSIENYCFSREALVNFIVSRKPTLNRNDLESEINFGIIEKCIPNNLKVLSFLYIIIQKYINELIDKKNENKEEAIEKAVTCKNKIEIFLKNSYDIFLDKEKVENFKEKITLLLNKNEIELNLNTFHKNLLLELDYNTSNDMSENHILGKYFLKLILNYLKNKYEFLRKTSDEEFLYALADKCDFSNLYSLKSKIENYIKN